MAPGTLELRLNKADGPAIQSLCGPGDVLFCVLGVGSVRYRSNSKPPSLPEWKEKFMFTVGDETELVIECWKGSSSGESLVAASKCPLEPVSQRPQGQLNAPMKDPSGTVIMKINLFYRFAIQSGGAQASSSAPSAPVMQTTAPGEPQEEGISTSTRAGPFDGPDLSNPYGIPTGPAPSSAYPGGSNAGYPYAYGAPPAAAPGYPPAAAQPGYPPSAGAPSYPPASYPPAYPPGQPQQQPPHYGQQQQQQPMSAMGGYPSAPGVASASDPGKGKAKFNSVPAGGHYSYAPPPVPTGYAGGGGGGLHPSGYPAAGGHQAYHQAYPQQQQAYYGGAGKPGKYKAGKQKKNKYSGYGMAAGGLAAGALAGVALGSMMGGGHHHHKGWGYKGPKWGFKGGKGFGFKGFKGGKGFGFKGFKGGKGFGFKGCKGGFDWK